MASSGVGLLEISILGISISLTASCDLRDAHGCSAIRLLVRRYLSVSLSLCSKVPH
jgi:hypothetical protein